MVIRRKSRKKSRRRCSRGRIKGGSRCRMKPGPKSRSRCSRGRIKGGSRCRRKPGPKRSRSRKSSGWIRAIKKAKKELGLEHEFVTINRGEDGIALYKRACEIYGNKTSGCKSINNVVDSAPLSPKERKRSMRATKKASKAAAKAAMPNASTNSRNRALRRAAQAAALAGGVALSRGVLRRISSDPGPVPQAAGDLIRSALEAQREAEKAKEEADKLKKMKLNDDRAVTVIQSLVRRLQAYKEKTKLAKQQEADVREDARNMGALAIQRVSRGMKGRERSRERRREKDRQRDASTSAVSAALQAAAEAENAAQKAIKKANIDAYIVRCERYHPRSESFRLKNEGKAREAEERGDVEEARRLREDAEKERKRCNELFKMQREVAAELDDINKMGGVFELKRQDDEYQKREEARIDAELAQTVSQSEAPADVRPIPSYLAPPATPMPSETKEQVLQQILDIFEKQYRDGSNPTQAEQDEVSRLSNQYIDFGGTIEQLHDAVNNQYIQLECESNPDCIEKNKQAALDPSTASTAAVRIQKMVRGKKSRKRYNKLLKAIGVVQARSRSRQAKRIVEQKKREKKAMAIAGTFSPAQTVKDELMRRGAREMPTTGQYDEKVNTIFLNIVLQFRQILSDTDPDRRFIDTNKLKPFGEMIKKLSKDQKQQLINKLLTLDNVWFTCNDEIKDLLCTKTDGGLIRPSIVGAVDKDFRGGKESLNTSYRGRVINEMEEKINQLKLERKEAKRTDNKMEDMRLLRQLTILRDKQKTLTYIRGEEIKKITDMTIDMIRKQLGINQTNLDKNKARLAERRQKLLDSREQYQQVSQRAREAIPAAVPTGTVVPVARKGSGLSPEVMKALEGGRYLGE